MPESAPSLLTAWSSFYVMAGSSAAALTGLMFVVISLVTGREGPKNPDGISTFSTPTVLHLGAALLISAILVAPWRTMLYAGILVALIGLYGGAYIVRVAVRTKQLTMYQPDLEDWTWYNVLPFVAYAAVFAGALALEIVPAKALFAIAGGAVLLIFIGIRNAWDVVTFLAVGGGAPPSS
jgi:hypothetical protein